MQDELKVLVYEVGNSTYATDIMQVERILKYTKPIELPEVPMWVEGVIEYEEKALQIISFADKMKLGSKESANTKIIVSNVDKRKVGFKVDHVREVKVLNLNDISKSLESVTGNSSRYIEGIVKDEDEMIILIDLMNVLSQDEKDDIKQVKGA